MPSPASIERLVNHLSVLKRLYYHKRNGNGLGELCLSAMSCGMQTQLTNLQDTADHVDTSLKRPVLGLANALKDVDVSDRRLEAFSVYRLDHGLYSISKSPLLLLTVVVYSRESPTHSARLSKEGRRRWYLE